MLRGKCNICWEYYTASRKSHRKSKRSDGRNVTEFVDCMTERVKFRKFHRAWNSCLCCVCAECVCVPDAHSVFFICLRTTWLEPQSM